MSNVEPPQQTDILTVDQALRQAISHHQQGHLQDAERLYRAILQAQPHHPDANHNLGVLAVQVKQPVAGLPHFKAALEAGPNQGQYWLSYIDALMQTGQADAARQALKQGRQCGLQGEAVDALELRLTAFGPTRYQTSNTVQQNTPHASVADTIELTSNEPDTHTLNRLMSAFNAGRYSEAEFIARDITIRFPQFGVGWKEFGAFLHMQGRAQEALDPMRMAVELLTEDAEAHNNLGTALWTLGQLTEAEASCRRALQIKPDYAEAYNSLANILMDLGRFNEAETSYRLSLRIKPDYAEAHNNLGYTLTELGRLNEAEASFRRSLQIKPDYAEAHNNLGLPLKELGRLDEAETSFRRALQIKPDFAMAHNNLGVTFQYLGRFADAEACYRQALQIEPDLSEAQNNLGTTLWNLGQLTEAEASCRRALEIKPDFTAAHSNLGSVLMGLGRLDEAEASYRRALEIKPDFAEAHSNLIFALDMADTVDLSELRRERELWDEAHAAPLWQTPIHSNDRSPDRRLRIGYVSADFREHSASKVFGGMLTRYDRSQFEVFAYSNSKKKDDRFTDLFKQSVTVWRNIGGLSDDAVARTIREDKIDILLDLSGHSSGNRLLVFARKPAPIQITAWGYATGTGMRAMDVFFTDPVMVPPQDRHYFSEEIRYLPCVAGSFFTEQFPDLNELPALSNGIITFGSFNRLAKVTEQTYRTWAKVLLAVPRSRLILKTPELNDASAQKKVIEHFAKAGVDADRIIMQGKTSWIEHMHAFRQVDFGLDPFPHGGGMTTLEGLMMGVPMITLRWPTAVGRLSASIMTSVGLTDWVAETQERYVELAIQKAADLQFLEELRQQLRGIFAASIIGDQVAYARAVEQEYRQLWREWCAKKHST